MNNEKKDKTPVSMAVYQQFVFDCAASLMEENCDKEQIIHRLIDLSNLPVFLTSPQMSRQTRRDQSLRSRSLLMKGSFLMSWLMVR